MSYKYRLVAENFLLLNMLMTRQKLGTKFIRKLFQKFSKTEVVVLCFVHPIFCFGVLVTFGDKVMKILRNLCLHFVRQNGQAGKTEKKISQLN